MSNGQTSPTGIRKGERLQHYKVAESRDDDPPRALEIEYWGRTDECLERKWAHMDMVDKVFKSRETCILSAMLKGAHTVLELNMFPYDTREGIEHWTLWSRDELDDSAIEKYICSWLRENAPHVESWNFDEKLARSIDIFHVHVYFKVPVDAQNELIPSAANRQNSLCRVDTLETQCLSSWSQN
ncbi:hypothetical protein BBJ28_00010809 [Nothophytophthora sp. Chile5]|nr:hypothetical protein BBJ28_00010809 [Nothophytophthora sp. Chile5]